MAQRKRRAQVSTLLVHKVELDDLYGSAVEVMGAYYKDEETARILGTEGIEDLGSTITWIEDGTVNGDDLV